MDKAEQPTKQALKPCPFCGREGEVYDPKDRKIAWHVFCPECSCEGPVSIKDDLVDTREQAIEAWNQRADDTANLRTAPLCEIDGSALAALVIAERHIVHMATWISKQNAGYSFEGLMEDKWIIDQALGDNSKAATRTTSLAAQDGLAMYLLECVYSEVRLEGKLHEDIRDFLYEGKNPLPAMSDVVKALEPFVDLKHQKSAWAIIEKSASDFEPVTLTVTKRQMLDLLSAIKGDKS